jgi:DedD protein
MRFKRERGMARAISDEELQLKKRARRRLVGAIVLVTAVAVILPMVLDSEPKPVSQNVDIQIPSPDAGEFKPKASPSARVPADTTPIKGMPQSKPAAPARREAGNGEKPDTASSSIADPGEAKAPAAQSAKDVPASKAASTEQKSPKEAPKAVAKDTPAAAGTYVVQVAALADETRVKQLQKQMAEAGVKTYTEVIATKAGSVTRVRAGPYPTREAAEGALTQLKKAGLDGKVAPK